MSRPPYIPMWIGDYLRDTQHLTTEQHGAYHLLIYHCWQHDMLPSDAVGRAQIARLPLKRWNQIKAPIEAFFADDGSHRRVTDELAKAERISVLRSIAGSKRGGKSATESAKQMLSKSRAPPPANSQQKQNKSSANAAAKNEQLLAYQNHKDSFLLTSSEYVAARATPEETHENQDKSAGELATALCGGALARPPVAEQEPTPPKPPSEVTRAEWDRMFAAKRGTDRLERE